MPWNAILIAAIALENNDRVYSLEQHFTEIAKVTEMLLYQPGHNGKYDPGIA